MTRPLLAFLLAAAPSVALAVPAQLTTQGRILDSAGAPQEDTVDVTFRLMDGESGGNTLWEETQSVGFTSGFYTVMLGADESGNPLEDSVLDQWPLYLEVQLDGEGPMFPRMAVGSVPYARHAGVATELAPGADIEAGSLTVAGTEVVASDGTWTGPAPSVDWGELNGVPGDFSDGDDADTLSDLVCTDGQWAVFDAATAAWACDGFSDSTLSDADVVVAVGTDAVDLYAGSTMDGYTILTEDSEIDWNRVTGLPAGLSDGDDDTLAGLLCSDGEVAAFDAAAGWSCGTGASAELAAEELVVGTRDSGTEYGSTDTPLAIPDAVVTGVTSTRYVGTSTVVETLSVDLDVAHADMGQLTVTLESPSGTTVTLYERNDPGQVDFSGNIGWDHPLVVGDLYAFHGEDASGVWILNAVDDTAGSTGTVNEWSIRINEAWTGTGFVGSDMTVNGDLEARGEVQVRGGEIVLTDEDGTEEFRIGDSTATTLYRMDRGCVAAFGQDASSGDLLTLSPTCGTLRCKSAGTAGTMYYRCGGSCTTSLSHRTSVTCTNSAVGTIHLY